MHWTHVVSLHYTKHLNVDEWLYEAAMPPYWCVSGLFFIIGLQEGLTGIGQEERLERHLFTNYSKNTRPVAYARDPLYVAIIFMLAKIEKIDEKQQQMVTFGWLIQAWRDVDLSWNKDDFDDMEFIVLPASLVWRPEMALLNSMENFEDLSFETNSRVRVEKDGSVTWIQGHRWVTECEVDLTLFPYDTQVDYETCKVTFMNWVHTKALLSYWPEKNEVILDAFTENAEWDLIEARVFNETQIFTFTPDERYPVIGFSLKLKRISTYYVYNIIIPVLILTLLSCLVYVMPSETGEKVGLQVTILLSFSVMLLVMGDTTPKAGKTTPLITSFITYIMCLLAVSLVITVSILSIHFHSTDKPVPKWAKIVVLNWIATIVCETRRRAKPEVSPSAKDPDKIPTVVSGSLISLDNSDKPQGGASQAELNLPGYLRAFILRRTETDEITANLAVNKADWQAVSRVLDRFFLIIFSIAMFIIIAETFYKY